VAAPEVRRPVKIKVLGLGNDLLADDGIGHLAVTALEPRLAGRADVEATALHGLALLDLLTGYDAAVVLDAACTGARPVGTVYEIDPATLARIESPSPHFAGFPEMLDLAVRLELHFPRRLRIIAVEVQDPWTIGGAMTPAVREALPQLCERAERAVAELAAG
jgi:hydrogenase maturation protease